MTTSSHCDDDALKMDYLADDLPPDERAAFAGHLAGCGACRAELEELALLADRIGGLEPPRCPAALARSTVGEMERVREVERRFGRDLRAVLIPLAGLAMMLLALVLWSIRPEPGLEHPVPTDGWLNVRFLLVGALLLILPAGLDGLGFLVVRRRLMAL